MKILIHGRNLELTSSLKEYTQSKIAKAINHYKDLVNKADVNLSIDKNSKLVYQSAEVTIFANGTIIRAQEKTNNLYSSIDLVSNKICRQLRKYKEKNASSINHSKTSKKTKYMPEDDINSLKIESLLKDGLKSDLLEPSIKNKYFDMAPISINEARIQLDLIDHDFYLFKNKIDNQLQVIYKRNSGGYGLIQSK